MFVVVSNEEKTSAAKNNMSRSDEPPCLIGGRLWLLGFILGSGNVMSRIEPVGWAWPDTAGHDPLAVYEWFSLAKG